jgi:hypothetical protein
MYGKNIIEKRWLTIIVALVIVSSGAVIGLSFQGLAATGKSNLTSTVGLGSDIGVVYGYNGTGKAPTWEAATLVTSGDTVTASFADGFNVTNIVAFQKNPDYTVGGLLNRSYLFTTLNVQTSVLSVLNGTGISETNNFALQTAGVVFGKQVNDTSTHALTDKGVIEANIWSSTVIYSSAANINNLNKTVEMNALGMLTGSFGYYGTILITLNNSAALASTNHLSVEITQSYRAPFDINVITVSQIAMVILGIIVFVGAIAGMPRRRER